MKAWSIVELENVLSALQPLVGARLQEVSARDRDLVLGFYSPSQRGLLWLWVDLDAVRPSLLPWMDLPLRIKDQKTPLSLFLRAHFRDRVLRLVERLEVEGRVLRLTFGRAEDENSPTLEVRLFPHARNVLARAEGKQVAWQRAKELTENPSVPEILGRGVFRDLETLREEWLVLRAVSPKKNKASADPEQKLKLELERREKALKKVDEELSRKREMPWRELGAWLKTNQSLDVPREWEPFVDKRRKLAWNIEQCFQKARDLDGKLRGTEQRREILVQQIDDLKHTLTQPDLLKKLSQVDTPRSKGPLSEIEAQGRTLRLEGEIMVVAGKNAADNLKLLRKARAWDLWIHLKDYPSSHAILFRNKTTKIGDAILHQAAVWFVRTHLGSKSSRHAGEKFSLLVAECRHVRPIKGDRLGRVTYHDERVLTFQLP